MAQADAPGQAAGPAAPRVLIVSASIGAGHDSAGRALEQAARRIWPRCEVAWLDILEEMGRGVAPAARWLYTMQIQRTPWLYSFFFAALWQHRWYLAGTRHLLGMWAGRRMARRVTAFGPDLIISTYPLGSAGLAWLRRRGLSVPAGAWVSDFCPHPYWVYRDLDITYVMHPAAVPVARRAEPGARVTAGCLPVTDAFVPAGRQAARAQLGLGEGFTVLLTAGSLGFGSIGQAVAAVLQAGPGIQVVAVCGRNERLRRRLEAAAWPAGRVRIVGWTDEMPRWMNAADVVATNGGGVTVAEAIACQRLLIIFDPIAGHGQANAQLLEDAGAALVCRTPADLTAAAARLAGDPTARARLLAAAGAGGTRRGDDDLAGLAATPARAHPGAVAGNGQAPHPAEAPNAGPTRSIRPV